MMADQSYLNAPSATVKKKFSASSSRTGGGDTAPVTMPTFENPDVAASPLPAPGIGPEDISSYYQPLLSDIQSEAAPAPRSVPAEVTPMGTFLGLLAGNLASTFGQDPHFAAQAQQYLADYNEKRQKAEDANYVNALEFDKARRNRLTTLRGQILDNQLEIAIQQKNEERQLAILKEKSKLDESLARERQRQDAAQRQALVQESGRQERMTERTKASVRAEEEKRTADKPLTTKEYLQALNDVAKNKELPQGSPWRTGAHVNLFGLNFNDTAPTSKEEALERIHATAILNGEPKTKAAAKENLKRSILKRLGYLGKSPTPESKEQSRLELEKLGLTPADVL